MSEYDFYLRGDPDVVRLQLVEITHPSFVNTYRYVRNHGDGVTVKHEDGVSATYDYYPLTIKKGKTSDDLDQTLTIGVGDLGEIVPQDLDRLRADANHSQTKPVLNYREYASNDLTKPMTVIKGLEVTDYEPQRTGAVFKCRTKRLNVNSTGVAYTLDAYPTLRGFL